MDSLKQKILNEGEVYEGNILKVDGFLNHRIDIPFMREIAKEFHRLFKDDGVNKILTIEASGIAIGALVAEEFGCPLVFAKKTKTKNIAGDVYTSDDFLAIGNALNGLIALVNDSGASLAGCGVVIEKGFQHGGDKLRSNGIKVESLAIVESMDHETGKVYFRD